jgi:hypothetical protein
MKKVSILVVAAALVACTAGDEGDHISGREKVAVMAAADAGDLVAIKRLIAHYEATLGNDVLAERWRERACDLGDAQELYYLAARRFAAAEVEDDAEIRHTLLVDAHDAAKRSHASQPDHSTQLLVEQIARAVQALEK